MATEQDRDPQFYAAAVNAWFGTRLEHDKSLLALSAGAIGLLVTLLSTIGAGSIEGVVLYIGALLSFLICLGSVLWVLRRNATHLERIVKENATSDPVLVALDRVAVSSFFLGVTVSAIIGITAAVQPIQPSEIDMSGKDKTENPSKPLKESVSGAHQTRPPQGLSKKSFDGAANMRPAPASTQTQRPPSTQSPAPAVPAAPTKPEGNEDR